MSGPVRRGSFLLVAGLALAPLALHGAPRSYGVPDHKADFDPGRLVPGRLAPAEPFETPDGKTGWKVRISKYNRLTTPAVADGRVFVGGGFGSSEFHALDATNGSLLWTYEAGDPGPASPVVADGVVTYNTESCTVYSHDAATGERLWNYWLGSPLLSQPAAAGGMIVNAYQRHGGYHLAALDQRTGRVAWRHQLPGEVISAPVVAGSTVYASTQEGSLHALELATGRVHWEGPVGASSAPRVAAGGVFYSVRLPERDPTGAPVEGVDARDAADGKGWYPEPIAARPAPYLAAPWEVDDLLEKLGGGALSAAGRALRERLERVQLLLRVYQEGRPEVVPVDRLLRTVLARLRRSELVEPRQVRAVAAELDAVRRDLAGLPVEVAGELEEQAGAIAFLADHAGATPETAEQVGILEARKELRGLALSPEQLADLRERSLRFPRPEAHLGHPDWLQSWRYQGSRPTVVGDRLVLAQGARLRAVDPQDGGVLWETTLVEKPSSERPVTPAALAGGTLYVGTDDGRLVAVDPEDGAVRWEARVGKSFRTEPVVSGGTVFAVDEAGDLVALRTGDPAADGWPMWGGSAGHAGPGE